MRQAILALALACAASGALADDATHAHAPGSASHWTYSGTSGPEHWAQISEAFHTCESGRAESPIDIRSTKKAPADTPRIQFSYEPVPVHLLNTGHAIQFAATPGKDSVTLGDTRYQLVQFHFHSPGEERFASRASPMDLHLVHADASGKLLVVAVQFVVGDTPNPVLGALLDDIPMNPGEEKTDNALLVNPLGLLPATKSGYYTYSGSLTTPPCSEGVTWIELKEPVTISRAQLEAMRGFYDHNQRPVQPLNGREILEVD
ncbi:carbonic anhydrase family protein [Trinickia terrae]|uniref:carbonic anhydrase n=1 Tax=Trinickia terrae TaxID=2571161 RepID=A0A4U1HNN8_9BURK|nr:carbonic anhydrase family protein [Trinickia terrae]TKC82975.1 carbonic anhydrase family protein [Trinickia terrae]